MRQTAAVGIIKATTPKTLEGKQTKVECFITEIAESCPVRFGRKPVSGLGGMLVYHWAIQVREGRGQRIMMVPMGFAGVWGLLVVVIMVLVWTFSWILSQYRT